MGAAREQVEYLVDMAKAEALDLPGESRQALDLVDRHVCTAHAATVDFGLSLGSGYLKRVEHLSDSDGS